MQYRKSNICEYIRQLHSRYKINNSKKKHHVVVGMFYRSVFFRVERKNITNFSERDHKNAFCSFYLPWRGLCFFMHNCTLLLLFSIMIQVPQQKAVILFDRACTALGYRHYDIIPLLDDQY